jgi:hypothetical protein
VQGWPGGIGGVACLRVLWRSGGEHGEGLPAAFSGSGRQALRGSARVVGLPGVEGMQVRWLRMTRRQAIDKVSEPHRDVWRLHSLEG